MILKNKSGNIVLDVILNVGGQKVPGVSLEWGTIRTNEELFKVPGNVCSLDRLPNEEVWVGHEALSVIMGGWQLFLQPGKDWVLIVSIHLNLVIKIPLKFKAITRPDMLENIAYLLTTGVFLVTKLVCWECQHSQLSRVLLAELVHLREVPGCCAS